MYLQNDLMVNKIGVTHLCNIGKLCAKFYGNSMRCISKLKHDHVHILTERHDDLSIPPAPFNLVAVVTKA